MKTAALAFSVLASLAVGDGCAGAPPSPPYPAPPPVAAPSPSASAAAAPSSSASAAARPVTPPRPPPPVVTAPMAGEPGGVALAEARLVTATCQDFEAIARKQAEARVKQMRSEVDDELRSWKQDQPSCWRRTMRPGSGGGLGLGRIAGSMAGSGAGSVKSAPAGGMGRAKTEESSARAAKSASGTNNQVVGVDEADIVKNDGRYVYLAMNGALRIVQALQPRLLSVTKLPGNVREMFVQGDRAVVYVTQGGNGRARCTYGYDCTFAGDGSSTKILVFDVTNRSEPKLTREIGLSGSLMAARRIGDTVHTVVSDGDVAPRYRTDPDDLDTCGPSEATARAKFAKLKRENEKKILATIFLPTIQDQGVERPICDRLLQTPISDGQAFTTVVSFDLRADRTPATTATLQSRPGAVFASGDSLYLSVTHRRSSGRAAWYSFYSRVNEVSDVHKFHIGARPDDTRYVGSGVVPGHVLNQFAMDEYYGYLRIATTRGRVPDPAVESSVSILAAGENGNLVRVGAVDKIAPGEDIRAVRFDDDRGYVVTFKKTDPLFVIDLYDPAHPVILGELKIPGFSTYIHRVDPEHLLSIGFDANDHGSFAYFDGIILQLFDVAQPTDPRLLFKEKIGTRGSSSAAATDHLAFNFFADRGLLAIPMTICEGGGDGRHGNDLAFSGLLVYDVSLERGFTRLGGIDHGTKGASCSSWWSKANSVVKRSIFLDDLVYSIATDRLKVQRLGHFGTDEADIALMP